MRSNGLRYPERSRLPRRSLAAARVRLGVFSHLSKLRA